MIYPSWNVKVSDGTIFQEIEEVVKPLGVNIMIPGIFEKGPTNVAQQFYAGEVDKFIKTIGEANYAKYGAGPDIAIEALRNDVDMGVMVVNVRPAGASCANVALAVKCKKLADVPKTNAQGAPLYLTSSGTEVTSAEGNTPIVRDVLETEFVKYTFTGVTNSANLVTKLDALYDDDDGTGVTIIPLVAWRYVGASAFGNNFNFRLMDKKSDSDGKIYHAVEIFNGETINNLRDVVSFFPDAVAFNQSVFIETLMKRQQADLKVVTSVHYDKFIDKLKEIVTDIDPMKINLFAPENVYHYRTKSSSLDVTRDRAFVLENGSNGDMAQLANAYKELFDGTMIPDINSAIRYRIDLIPDLEFSDEVKNHIEEFVKLRKRTTSFRRLSGSNSFESAITDYTSRNEDNPHVSLVAACQRGIMFNAYAKRSFNMPASYFDAMAFINHVKVNKGIPYLPFSGSDIRWKGFEEDSMMYPKEDETVLTALANSRINYIKKDRELGGYLNTQLTRTRDVSDQTEFSNIMMIQSILYDLIAIIHNKQYKFNDPADVAKFNEDISLDIQPTYKEYSTFITTNVFKKGRFGYDKTTNVIKVVINFKDLFKTAEIELDITDKTLEELK